MSDAPALTVWSIGLYAGRSPLSLREIDGREAPLLCAGDVRDVRCEFVADPFVVRWGSKWLMFFEAMPEATQRGVVCLAESVDGMSWAYQQVVLAEPFHLSYPHVFAWRGEWYMTPETLAADCVRLYRAARFPFEWIHCSDLVRGPHADPTPFRSRGAWWMYTCGAPFGNDELRLFHSESLLRGWQEHPQSPVVSGDMRLARPAGRVLKLKSGLFRLAQDCRLRYGHQVWAVEVSGLSRQDYAEHRAAARLVLVPGSASWNQRGMHQIDAFRSGDGRWLAVVDGYGGGASSAE